MKRCARCQQDKPTSDFSPNRSRRDGLQNYCKKCRIDTEREYKNRREQEGYLSLAARRTAPEGFKECARCKQQKSLADFGKQRDGFYKLKSWCKECCSWYQRVRTHKLSKEEYQILYDSQKGVCKICGQKNNERYGEDNLCIDHDHKTGIVRGLLCGTCNAGIGHLQDDPNLLRAAADYLKFHRSK